MLSQIPWLFQLLTGAVGGLAAALIAPLITYSYNRKLQRADAYKRVYDYAFQIAQELMGQVGALTNGVNQICLRIAIKGFGLTEDAPQAPMLTQDIEELQQWLIDLNLHVEKSAWILDEETYHATEQFRSACAAFMVHIENTNSYGVLQDNVMTAALSIRKSVRNWLHRDNFDKLIPHELTVSFPILYRVLGKKT